MKEEKAHSRVSRRQILLLGGATAAGTWTRLNRIAAAPRIQVDDLQIVSRRPHLYHGWPTVCRASGKELLLVCSGGREAHVCPFGRVELMRSEDGGSNWTSPEPLFDSPIDDRDAGVLQTGRGTWLVTTFTSLAYQEILEKAERNELDWPESRLQRWRRQHRLLSPDGRKEWQGVWMMRSTDSGSTWSSPYDCLVNSPHGPVELEDGRLLYAGKDLWRSGKIGVCQSLDDGIHWEWLAEISPREGDETRHYHELHTVETEDGRILVQIRNHNPSNRGETLQSESHDGGRSWSVPRSMGVWGLPSHLLRLTDGRLLMTYGHRREPLGNRARISEDHGETWSTPLVVSADGTSRDLGYPSSVQLDDGSLLTIWYEKVRQVEKAVLRQARWRILD